MRQEFVPGGRPPSWRRRPPWSAAGQQPDVVFNEAIRWREAAAKGLYEVLDPYLAREKQLLADVFPFFVDIGKWQGKAYATPIDPSMYVLVHNLRVWRADGVPAPDPRQPLTWPELTDRARRLSKELGREVHPARGTTGPTCTTSSSPSSRPAGRPPSTRTSSRWNMDQPEAISQIQLLADMRRSQKAAGWPGAPTDGPLTWENGKVGTTIRGIWGAGAWRTQLQDEWDWAPYPQVAGKKRITFGRGSGLSLGSQTRAKPASWEFMKWSLGVPAQEIYLSMGASQPLTSRWPPTPPGPGRPCPGTSRWCWTRCPTASRPGSSPAPPAS